MSDTFTKDEVVLRLLNKIHANLWHITAMCAEVMEDNDLAEDMYVDLGRLDSLITGGRGMPEETE